ncbi:hydrogenase maturation peptidase HycI [Candidatus Bathyarchaeota archaeon]|jgi:hydrogenase 3 maturation protease|nr:hydrogenase maturation peptidase HycI [Candidatus Bathyarchaeota archaeon]MBT4319282.1 hydrogenase maturation peptidase HycI [Candidatus Bathyarchaeota archaeon]MBT4422894.1 hydrogenase maturation peptidase HycI [Candidatus Bathyarchaeota archaeon]MBT5643448.1 hydrogenase maturation peptidase HycI [Candidatus Bathyarchaeota archaeon]MBT6603868.1 hydrogenase maturation peptidase HycI [Candidatus Bathyarchaeota archaeon]
MSLHDGLREYLGENLKRVALVGVGNPLRADDGVGPRVIELLEERHIENVLLINAETVPESYVGKVVKYEPTHVLLIDAANFRGHVGETRLILGGQIDGHAVSTHSLPLTIFIKYVERSAGVRVLLLGVQPKTIEFYQPMSPEIENAAISIADTLFQELSE